jgi:membrane-associated phospholipid phosphatase
LPIEGKVIAFAAIFTIGNRQSEIGNSLDRNRTSPTIPATMVGFSLPLLLALIAACGIMMMLEWRGLPTTLSLHFKGDIKRESRWLAQYGQAICTVVAGVLVWQLEGPGPRRGLAVPVLAAPFGTTLVATVVKKLLSRVRPGRPDAGRFLGPTLSRGNYKESFPSSHSACAMALSTTLSVMYPAAAVTFWALALGCAGLRYVLDAHWPSDVLGGIALGYGLGYVTLWLCGIG